MRIIHWPGFVGFMVIVSILAIVVRLISGLPLWACFLIAMFGVLINGIVAAWEDDRPGGFNNPQDQKPRDPKT